VYLNLFGEYVAHQCHCLRTHGVINSSRAQPMLRKIISTLYHYLISFLHLDWGAKVIALNRLPLLAVYGTRTVFSVDGIRCVCDFIIYKNLDIQSAVVSSIR